jgi:hypothetical protein
VALLPSLHLRKHGAKPAAAPEKKGRTASGEALRKRLQSAGSASVARRGFSPGEVVMSSRQNLYVARSGELAVMAQFLVRGYNVAMPEVDVGEDVFVVRDRDAELSRVQVKAAFGKGKKRQAGTFKVPLLQLYRDHAPELYYVFTLYHGGLWREFVIIRRPELVALHEEKVLGHIAGKDLILYLSFVGEEVRCSDTSLTGYRNNWSNWPFIRH